MQQTVGISGRRISEVGYESQQFGAQMGPQNLTLEIFPEGRFSSQGATILLSETRQTPYETTSLFVTGDDRLRVIATIVNSVLETNVQETIGQTADEFGSWALKTIEAALPARLARSSTEREFLEIELLPIFAELAALYYAGDKSTKIAIPEGVPAFGIMQDVGTTTWNSPKSGELQVSIATATKKICVQPGRKTADTPQTLAVLGRHVGSLKGPFAANEGWVGGHATVISADRGTLTQFDANSQSVPTFSIVDYFGYVEC